MPDQNTTLSNDKPRLYHASSSYYSMIARLALAEAGIGYDSVFVDIHARMSQQLPDYVKLNPNMTVPTLVLPRRILVQSSDIAEFALGVTKDRLNADSRQWLDLHYSYPIDELTFSGFLAGSRLARIIIPSRIAASRRRLLAMALANPDLADAYKARAAAFAERARVFDPGKTAHLVETRRGEAIGLMDRLESSLGDGRAVLVPPTYGIADVVWTVFLARMQFAGMVAEIGKRPALARYWNAMQARPSFAAADIWTRLHVLRLIGGILVSARH